MKRVLALILTLIMILPLFSCASGLDAGIASEETKTEEAKTEKDTGPIVYPEGFSVGYATIDITGTTPIAYFGGIANGIMNFFVLLLTANKFPASVLYPVVSGGSLLMIFLWSFLIKKEKFTPSQYVGYILGVASLVLLNI